jgi:hypothetical protein
LMSQPRLIHLVRSWPHLAAAVGALLVSVLMTWPLAVQATDHVLGAMYFWDAYTNTMIMGGRVDAALGRGPLSFYDNYFFAPLPNTTAFNENLFGLSLIFAPLYLISGNPLLAYNTTLLLSLSLSVFFTYLLVRRLTGNGWAGMLAGIAFACSPYVLFEIGRIQLVATQWIPACFLMLHRAVERRRWLDVAGFWACYVLQIGTCLYYAMFLIPLLGLAGGVLLYRERPPRRLYISLLSGGVVAGAVALLMVYPYFASRGTFDLERSLEFASAYDGKLSFFANVPPTNHTLTALHHQGEFRGAHEEIAFPGFTVIVLALLALGAAARNTLRDLRNRARVQYLAYGAILLTFAVALSLVTRSLLAGAVLLGIASWLRARSNPSHSKNDLALYGLVTALAVVMFLGLEPLSFRGEPVRGIYYYFHTYFPGFNGIRKVSRQAVMTTFALAILASFGSAWLLGRLRRTWQQVTTFGVLLVATCFELRSFPHALFPVWSGERMPRAYQFLAQQPKDDLVVSLPQHDGQRLFRWDHGLALHNYLMLFHKHRSPNGQSSWEPTVTTLVNHALDAIPNDTARRILRSVGARHLLIHGRDMPEHRRDLPHQLQGLPTLFHHAYHDGDDHVFTLLEAPDDAPELLATPPLPSNAKQLSAEALRAHSNLESATTYLAVDGDRTTYWTSQRLQGRGQTFELELVTPLPLVALELESPAYPLGLPLAYEVAVTEDDETWRVVTSQPQVRVPHDLVFAPKRYVLRTVFAAPERATRVKLTIESGTPGVPFVVHEARLYTTDD